MSRFSFNIGAQRIASSGSTRPRAYPRVRHGPPSRGPRQKCLPPSSCTSARTSHRSAPGFIILCYSIDTRARLLRTRVVFYNLRTIIRLKIHEVSELNAKSNTCNRNQHLVIAQLLKVSRSSLFSSPRRGSPPATRPFELSPTHLRVPSPELSLLAAYFSTRGTPHYPIDFSEGDLLAIDLA